MARDKVGYLLASCSGARATLGGGGICRYFWRAATGSRGVAEGSDAGRPRASGVGDRVTGTSGGQVAIAVWKRGTGCTRNTVPCLAHRFDNAPPAHSFGLTSVVISPSNFDALCTHLHTHNSSLRPPRRLSLLPTHHSLQKVPQPKPPSLPHGGLSPHFPAPRHSIVFLLHTVSSIMYHSAPTPPLPELPFPRPSVPQ